MIEERPNKKNIKSFELTRRESFKTLTWENIYPNNETFLNVMSQPLFQVNKASKDLETFMRKDPPVLTMDEMRTSAHHIDKYIG